MTSRRRTPAALLLILLVAISVVVVERTRIVRSDGTQHSPAPHGQSPSTGPAAVTGAPTEPDQPGTTGSTGAPPPEPAAPSLSLLGHTDFGGQGPTGNVRALGSYAYVGSWDGGRCPALGVRVVDLSDPANPREVAKAARYPGTSAEDVVPIHMSTPSFTGDLLAAGIQRCTSGSGPSGLALWDVTDPRNPTELKFFSTGSGTRGVHELDVVTREDGRVLALLAVPYSEPGAGDFRIVDITDPRNPAPLSSWGARRDGGITGGVGCNRSVYDHSAKGSADATRAYLSYWDAGVIILDISDPTAPRYLGRAFDEGAEGAIHSVDQMPNGLLLVTEEDDVYNPPHGLRLSVEGGGLSGDFAACEADTGTRLDRVGVVSGPLADGRAGCDATPSLSTGAVLLVDDAGGCNVSARARRAAESGAAALIVIQGGRAPETISSVGNAGIPVVTVGHDDGLKLRTMIAAAPLTVTLPSARPWGGVRVWDVSDPSSPRRVGLFRTEDAERFPPPSPAWATSNPLVPASGVYTVHNPLSVGDHYGLFSWYTDGVRLVDLSDPANPREVASFVPSGTDRNGATRMPLVWGVALSGNLVLVSDIDSGLFVLRLDGADLSR